MPNWPKDRRGKKETLEHYKQRLINARVKAYQSSAKHQWGEWLNTFPWKFILHYTFEKPHSVDGARRAFQDYLQKCPRCYCYYSVEENPKGHVHIHALIGRVEHKDELPRWGLGREQEIQQFDNAQGAAWYVSKCRLEWHMFGWFPNERPANAHRWWRPWTTLDPTNIPGLSDREDGRDGTC